MDLVWNILLSLASPLGGALPVLIIATVITLLPFGPKTKSARFLYAFPIAGLISMGLGHLGGGFSGPLDLLLAYGIPMTVGTTIAATIFFSTRSSKVTPRPAADAAEGKADLGVRERAITEPRPKRGRIKRWFWASFQQGENSAQTAFRVFGNLLRTAATVAAAAFVGQVAIMLVQTAVREANRGEKNFEAYVSFDGKHCPRHLPAHIQLTNKSNEMYLGGWYNYHVRERGTSKPIQLFNLKPRVRQNAVTDPFELVDDYIRLIDVQIPPEHSYHFCDDDFANTVVLSLEREHPGALLSDYEMSIQPSSLENSFVTMDYWHSQVASGEMEGVRRVDAGAIITIAESERRGWSLAGAERSGPGVGLSREAQKIPIDDKSMRSDYGQRADRIDRFVSGGASYRDELLFGFIGETLSPQQLSEFLVGVEEGIIRVDLRMFSAEEQTILDDRSFMRAVRARISSRLDLTTGRILEENEAPSIQDTPSGDMQSAGRAANDRVSSLVQEYTTRKTVHGINYSVPRDWSEVSPGDFRAEEAKVAGNMQSDVAAYLADTDLIFAIGKSEDGVSNAVLTMRVSNLAADEAFGQNDMKGLSEQERLELVSATEQSMGGMTAMAIPGLSSLELLEVNLVDAGNLLCIEATFTAMRDDGRDAIYTNWNCPLDRLNLSLSFHVRSDRFEEYMPVVGDVLASLKYRS